MCISGCFATGRCRLICIAHFAVIVSGGINRPLMNYSAGHLKRLEGYSNSAIKV